MVRKSRHSIRLRSIFVCHRSNLAALDAVLFGKGTGIIHAAIHANHDELAALPILLHQGVQLLASLGAGSAPRSKEVHHQGLTRSLECKQTGLLAATGSSHLELHVWGCLANDTLLCHDEERWPV